MRSNDDDDRNRDRFAADQFIAQNKAATQKEDTWFIVTLGRRMISRFLCRQFLCFIVTLFVLHSSVGFNIFPSFGTQRGGGRPSRLIVVMSSTSSSRAKDNTKKAIYPWREARQKARSYGFSSKEEFIEYECPG